MWVYVCVFTQNWQQAEDILTDQCNSLYIFITLEKWYIYYYICIYNSIIFHRLWENVYLLQSWKLYCMTIINSSFASLQFYKTVHNKIFAISILLMRKSFIHSFQTHLFLIRIMCSHIPSYSLINYPSVRCSCLTCIQGCWGAELLGEGSIQLGSLS